MVDRVWSSAPLFGVRVGEVGRTPAVRYAGRLLAELGAQVVPLGPTVRPITDADAADAVPPGPVEQRIAAVDAFLDARKLPSADAADEAVDFDVLLVDHPLEPADSMPPPGVIVVTVAPFGANGPYRDYVASELTLAAFSGLLRGVGEPDRYPLLPAGLPATLQAGVSAAIGVLAALLRRDRDGDGPVGQLVDVAEYETLATVHAGGLYTLFEFGGPADHRQGRRRLAPYPFAMFECRDGQVIIDAIVGREWKRLIAAMGSPEWTAAERYRDRRRLGTELYAEADALMAPWLMAHTRQEIFQIGKDHRIPIAPVRTIPEVIDSAQLAVREFFHRDEAGRLDLGLPFVVTEAAADLTAPGEHPRRRPPQPAPVDQSVPRSMGEPVGALDGVRVLDLGRVVAAPLVGALMADLGADVIKIESRTRLDPGRMGRPIMPELLDEADAGGLVNLMAMFHNVNRGKRSVTLDLASPAARDIVLRLVESADVVIENFKAGTLESFGLGFDELVARNPSIVLTRLSGTGQFGPDRDVLTYAGHAVAMAGVAGLTGYPGEAPLGLAGSNFGDANAAMYAALATLAALRVARRTGRGSQIDLSMVECAARHVGPEIIAFDRYGTRPLSRGNGDDLGRVQAVYPCQGEDEWLAISVADEAQWQALCATLLVDLPRPEVVEPGGDRAERNRVDEAIAARTATWSKYELFHALQGVGVDAAPVPTVEEQVFDEHVRARGIVTTIEHPVVGEEWLYGFPFQIVDAPLRVRSAAPDLGAHTDEVLGAAGYDDADRKRLRAAGAVE